MTLLDHSPSAPPAVRAFPAQPATVRPRKQGAPRPADRYPAVLLTVALAALVVYHIFGWAWLPAVVPSVAIMFGLAGARVAAALDRTPGHPWVVTGRGIRHLLPPLWLFGLVVVPVMIWRGWTYNQFAGSPLRWRTLLLWILPISDPPGSAWGDDLVSPLWFIRSCLWFMLLSPALLWLFRHWPKRVLVVPLVILAAGTTGVVSFGGRSGDVVLTLGIFGACWMLGFARHDNRLRALRPRAVVPLGVALLLAGLAWALTHRNEGTSWDLNDIPMAEALYGLGAVLLVLRWHPSLSWLSRRPFSDRLVAAVSSRATTIYLWNSLAVICAAAFVDSWAPDTASLTVVVDVVLAVTTAVLVAVAVVAFGWVEDLAARQPVRVIPWRRDEKAVPAAARPAPSRRRRALRPAHVLIGTAVLAGAAAVASVLALYGTDTPGRTGVADTVPNTATHPRVLTPRPPNLARPDAGVPATPWWRARIGDARRSAAPAATQRPAAAPNPAASPSPSPTTGGSPGRPAAVPTPPAPSAHPGSPAKPAAAAPKATSPAGRAPVAPAARPVVKPSATPKPQPARSPAPPVTKTPAASPPPPSAVRPATSAPPPSPASAAPATPSAPPASPRPVVTSPASATQSLPSPSPSPAGALTP